MTEVVDLRSLTWAVFGSTWTAGVADLGASSTTGSGAVIGSTVLRDATTSTAVPSAAAAGGAVQLLPSYISATEKLEMKT